METLFISAKNYLAEKNHNASKTNLAKRTTVHIKLANGLLIEFRFSLIQIIPRRSVFRLNQTVLMPTRARYNYFLQKMTSLKYFYIKIYINSYTKSRKLH